MAVWTTLDGPLEYAERIAESVICPKCKTDHAHRSHRAAWKDYVASLFQYYPYRCKGCGLRFFGRRRKPTEIEEKPTSTETEIRATRASYQRKERRREFLLYGSALLAFVCILYYLTRDRGSSSDGE